METFESTPPAIPVDARSVIGGSQSPATGDGQAIAMMRYDANKRSTLVAYLLWLVLGMAGAHRFYLGRTGSGIAMLVITLVSFLLTFVVVGAFGLAAMGLWVLVDAFLIPGMVQQHNNRLIASLR